MKRQNPGTRSLASVLNLRKRTAILLAAFAATVVALFSPAGSASAASFEANPDSLGGIPDGPGPGCPADGAGNRDVTFAVGGVALPITNVAVTIKLSPTHSWVGHLSIALISPDGVGITTIFERTGASISNEFGYGSVVDGPYTFSDAAPASPSWWQAAFDADPFTIDAGSYRASFPGGQAAPPPGQSYLLTPAWAGYFAGTPSPGPNGTWILRFRDHCLGYTGSVAAATLALNEALTTPAPGTTAPTATPSTGQRAAALKKCKKKKSKKARKKCKKKAKKLPV